VLVRGESGSGKELVARAIHFSTRAVKARSSASTVRPSPKRSLKRALRPRARCLHRATDKKIGKFEASDHGTIFLDEIARWAYNTQAKLLRVLEGHPFERVGARRRSALTCASSPPQSAAREIIKEGKFRRDLFYRLQVVEIHVPTMRERRTDVPMLASIS